MKIFLLLLFLLCTVLIGKTTDSIEVVGISEDKILIKKDIKFMFWNKNGKKIFSTDFQEAALFSEDMAGVKSNNMWGYINSEGKIIVSFKYSEVMPFKNQMAIVKKNKKYGLINKIGKEIITPKYDYISEFSEGYAIFKINSKYGVINEKGLEIVKPKYDYISGFSEGLARVEIDSKYGIIDKEGKIIIPIQYINIYDYHNGMAVVVSKEKYNYANTLGNINTSIGYDYASDFSKYGFAIVGLNGKNLIINKTLEIIKEIECADNYNSLELYGITSLLTLVSMNEAIFFDSQGGNKKVVSSFIRMSDGMLLVKEKNDNKMAYERYEAFINENGVQITPFKYYFYDEGALSSVDDYQYDFPEFINGYCIVRIGNYDKQLEKMNFLYGLIDNTGKEIIPVEYAWIYNATRDTGILVDKNSKKLGVYNIADKKLDIKWIFTGVIKN